MLKHMALGATVVAVLAATNPGEDAHRVHLTDHLRAACGENPVARMLCGGMAELAAANVRYRDFGLFSTARLGDAETLGLLGVVMVVRG